MINWANARSQIIAYAAMTVVLSACGGGTPAITGGPSPSPSASPPLLGASGSVPLTIVNNDSATIPSASINVYITGLNAGGTEPMYADRYGNETIMSSGSTPKPIPWIGSGNTETLYLPPSLSARVYIVNGTISNLLVATGPPNAGVSAPAPWANDGSQAVYFDDVEYSYTNGNVNFDTSQTDALGLDLTIQTTGTGALSPPNTTVGFGSGAINALASALNALGAPWSSLAEPMPYHIINPQHGSPNFFSSATFLDAPIMTAWNAYTGNWMEISAASLSATTYPGALYGTVDSSGNFDFYTAQSTSSTLVGSIANPQTYASNNPGQTVTVQMLAQNGAFNSFMTPYTPVAQQYPALGPAIGNRLSGALNSGVMNTASPPAQNSGALISVQPVCTGRFPSPSAAPYENQYAAAIHTVSNTYGNPAGAAYGYPYDDLCNTSTDTTQYGLTHMTVTINP